MKKLALLLLLSCISLATQAQIYAEDYVIKTPKELANPKSRMIYGVMAGVLIPQMSDKNNNMDVNNTAGYHLGFMWGLDLGKLEIVPEFWYDHYNSEADRSSNDTGKLISQSIEVPVVFAIELGPVRLNFGPTFALMSNTKYKRDNNGETIDLGRTRSTAGYLVGASLLMKKHFLLDFRYEGCFLSSSEIAIGGESHEYRYYNYSVNIGYRF